MPRYKLRTREAALIQQQAMSFIIDLEPPPDDPFNVTQVRPPSFVPYGLPSSGTEPLTK